tara:strand:- start:352 stop:543 length:192 start_codon:yes stop_codon:yes gene_type:complete
MKLTKQNSNLTGRDEMNIKSKDLDHLRDVIGSLMIKQFKGKDKQDQYRAVINMIFSQLPKKER